MNKNLDSYQHLTESDLQYVLGGFDKRGYNTGAKIGNVVRTVGKAWGIYKIGKFAWKYGKYLK